MKPKSLCRETPVCILKAEKHCMIRLRYSLFVTIIISGIVMSLSRVDEVFCFCHYFLYSPLYKPLLVYLIPEAILLVVISGIPMQTNLF